MIGLFLGTTDFPKLIINNLTKKNIKYFIIDLTNNNRFIKNNNSYHISIGQFGKILNLIKEKKCNKVLFAGKIDKPRLSTLKLDFKGLFYMSRIIAAFKLGDAAILRELIKILAEHKIKVIRSNFFNPELTLKRSDLTILKPNNNDLIQIKKGIMLLNKLNAHNHVQGLIVSNNNVVAKESAKGTKKMLLSFKKLKNSEAILIKFPKKKQDLRVDLPTIGIDTLKDCSKADIKGIVLKSKQNIFLDRKKCINFANKNKIFITIK
ncbi:UDP-2,3-diacylglucosamine diphosphatase LpxI domain-containing protein [Candidatus Pelagibacter sp. Uisw_090]|uniref:UDP-2,3-diacylglucosamine diphosphatase LpxI domain-containing protein n=1 Tax=Candidatus Pelagibacter sp. Uisw_090 TaxID=3230993 RepID=UPI0039E912F4